MSFFGAPATCRMARPVALTMLVMALCASLSAVAQQARPEVTVSAAPLSELVISQQAFAQARVLAANHAVVAAQIAAEVISIHADVGDVVKKGVLLAQLDQRDYALALQQAEAQLASIEAQIAQADYRLKRARELSGSQYLSADDLLARETDVSVLTANRIAQRVAISIAKNNLSRARITAPFDAAVVARTAQRGSFVTVAAPMFDLVELNHPEVEAMVAAEQIENLHNSSDLVFVRGSQQWPLTLLRISPVVESDSGTQRVRLQFSALSAPIGSSGQLRWRGAGLFLPADMLVQRTGELGVFVVDGNIARFHALPQAQEGRPADVDLPVATLLVTDGRFRIQDGQTVNVTAR